MTLDQILFEAYQNGQTYHAIFGAIIGGIASVASAALGSRKQKTSTDSVSTSTVDFQKLAADAQAAGFNPLTALRSGAIGGYVTTRTKGNSTTSGGGGGIGAGIADAVAGLAPMFGNSMARNDPISLKSKTSGAVSSTVAGQVFAGTRRAGSVVVAPRQTTVTSPVTSYEQAEKLNGIRMHNGSFIGPRMPQGAGPNGEILDAMVAYRRSDGSLMWTYNPTMIDGDAAIAAGIADGSNRANDEINTRIRYPVRKLPQTMLPTLPAQSGKVGRYAR